MLEAVAGRELLERSYEASLAEGYRWHEFGDVHLILRVSRRRTTGDPVPSSIDGCDAFDQPRAGLIDLFARIDVSAFGSSSS